MYAQSGLLLESLESRTLLASIAWDGGPSTNGTDMLDPINWAGDVLPGPADDVTIQAVETPILRLRGDMTLRSLLTTDRVQIESGTLHILTTGKLQGGGGITLDGGTLRGGTWQGSGLVATANVNNRLVDASFQAPTFNGGRLILEGSTTFTAMTARNAFTLGVSPGMTIQFPITVQAMGMFIEMADAPGTLTLAPAAKLTVQSGSTLTIGSNETHEYGMTLDLSSDVAFTQQGGTLAIHATSFTNRSEISLPSIGAVVIESAYVENFGEIRGNEGSLTVNGGWWINHGLVTGSNQKYVNILTSTFENKGVIQGGKRPTTITGLHGDAGELKFTGSVSWLALSGVFELTRPTTISTSGFLSLDGIYTISANMIVDSSCTLELLGQPVLEQPIDVYGTMRIGGAITLATLDMIRNHRLVDLRGNLDLEGQTLTIGALAIDWRYGGTIRNGIIDATKPLHADIMTLTLKNVDVQGSVIATADVVLAGTTRFDTLTLNFADLGVEAGMTLGGTIIIAAGSDPWWPKVAIGATTTGGFTLGEDCTLIIEAGFQGTAQFGWSFNNKTTTVVHHGTILVNGGSLYAGVISQNTGTIEVTGGGYFGAVVSENTGSISATGAGSAFGVGAFTNETGINRGSIHLGAGATGTLSGDYHNEGQLTFDGELRVRGGAGIFEAMLGDYSRGAEGFITLGGDWRLDGRSLTANAKTGSLRIDGWITGGVLDVEEGSRFIPIFAYLTDVDVRAMLVMDAVNSSVYLAGTTRFESLHMRGGDELRLMPSYTLRDDVYFEPSDSDPSPLYRISIVSTEPATIASEAALVATAGYTGRIELGGSNGGEANALINKGTIRLEGAGSSLTMWVKNFTNQGLIDGREGTQITIRSREWGLHTGSIQITGGALTLKGAAKTQMLGLDRITIVDGVGDFSMSIDNTGSTLVFDASRANWQMRSAAITGGVVEVASGTQLRIGKQDESISSVSLTMWSVEVRSEIVMDVANTRVLFYGTTSADAVYLAAKDTQITVPAGTLTTRIIAEGDGAGYRTINITTKQDDRTLIIPEGISIELEDGLMAPVRIASTSFVPFIINEGLLRVGAGAFLDAGIQGSIRNEGVIEVGAGGSIRSGSEFVQAATGDMSIVWGLGMLTPAVIAGSGSVVLEGTIAVLIDDDNPPMPPELFTLAEGSSVQVGLEAFIIPPAPMYQRIETVQTASLLALRLTSIADIDGNGFVDVDDYTTFESLHGTGDDNADLDGDGDVDEDDFSLFLYVFELG